MWALGIECLNMMKFSLRELKSHDFFSRGKKLMASFLNIAVGLFSKGWDSAGKPHSVWHLIELASLVFQGHCTEISNINPLKTSMFNL